MKLKVCGMKFADNISAVEELNPDFMGFIFYPRSPRFVDVSLPKKTKKIQRVGVFVDQDLEFVLKMIDKNELDFIQLHGKESFDFCEAIKTFKPSIKIIKVFSILNDFNFEKLEPYENTVDYFLFDTKGPAPGGNGFMFNWEVLNNYNSDKPFFLSGGIGLEEIADLEKFKRSNAAKYCYAVDVNSKFETEPGKKNIEKLKKFKNLL